MNFINKKIEVNYQKEFEKIERYIKNPSLISKMSEDRYKDFINKMDRFILMSNEFKKCKTLDKKLINNYKKQVMELKENAYIYRVNWNIYL